MGKICGMCWGKSDELYSNLELFKEIDGINYCRKCSGIVAREKARNIKATSTNNIDGYYVEDYIDIDNIEIVVGTGIFSEFDADISDFFGLRSTKFEEKLQKAKAIGLEALKFRAYEKGGNGLIGVDIDYTEFTGNRIGVVLNGTIVKLHKIKNFYETNHG